MEIIYLTSKIIEISRKKCYANKSKLKHNVTKKSLFYKLFLNDQER